MENKQTILVAGATGNIGNAAVLALAKRGARVVLLGRSVEKLETKESIKTESISLRIVIILFYSGDILKPGILFNKRQLNRAYRAITLLGNN